MVEISANSNPTERTETVMSDTGNKDAAAAELQKKIIEADAEIAEAEGILQVKQVAVDNLKDSAEAIAMPDPDGATTETEPAASALADAIVSKENEVAAMEERVESAKNTKKALVEAQINLENAEGDGEGEIGPANAIPSGEDYDRGRYDRGRW